MSIQINPCPFCGSGQCAISSAGKRAVVCMACGAIGPCSDNDEEMAIMYWNCAAWDSTPAGADDAPKCAVCGAAITDGAIYPGRRFCSRECSRKYFAAARRARYACQKPTARVCPICGKSFMGLGPRRYCSDACSSEARRRTSRRWSRKKKLSKIADTM